MLDARRRKAENLRIMTLSPVKEPTWVMLVPRLLYALAGNAERALLPPTEFRKAITLPTHLR
jgi:hypothetical protein